MDFLSGMKKVSNYAVTENGAVAKATTNSDLLDLFSKIGALRTRSQHEILNAFVKGFNEDNLLATRMLFHTRDIRGGLGERRTPRMILKFLANNYPDVVRKNIMLIPFFGRWDDLYELFDTQLEKEAGDMIKIQFNLDMNNDTPSLLGKWLKSENTSSDESRRLASKTRKMLGLTPRQYRKALSELRQKINILERLMASKNWSAIEYDKLPSQAGLKYRKAFKRNDEVRYQDFLNSLEKGEKKVNASTLFPYQLVGKVLEHKTWERINITPQDRTLYNEMWKALPDYIGDSDEDAMAVVDVSGSMDGDPMNVAISLGLYMAEKNKGRFKNHFITFESNPKLVEIKGKDFVDKIQYISSAPWGGSTNIEGVFDLILDTAILNKMSQSEMPKKLYIISDMEFDQASGYSPYAYRGRGVSRIKETLFQHIAKKYKDAGYEMPRLIFWNVDSRNDQQPMSMDERGFQLVSGCSPSIFQATIKGDMLSAYDLMLEVINGDRYKVVTI